MRNSNAHRTSCPVSILVDGNSRPSPNHFAASRLASAASLKPAPPCASRRFPASVEIRGHAKMASSLMKTFTIAVIAGDGVGGEVIPEGKRVLEAVGKKHNVNFAFQDFDWGAGHFQ